MTNVFVTRLSGYRMLQADTFEPGKDVTNRHRLELGLAPLDTPDELYEADLVCLADPHRLVREFGALPPNYISCGASFWESDMALPADVPDLGSGLIFLMGSTGRAAITAQTVAPLRQITGATCANYAGNKAQNAVGVGRGLGRVGRSARTCQGLHHIPRRSAGVPALGKVLGMAVFSMDAQVSFGDCDPAGIVYYPNFYVWIDRCFHAFLYEKPGGHKGLCKALGAQGLGLMEARMTFRSPAGEGDRLALEITAIDWADKSFTLTYRAHVGARLVFEASETRGVFLPREDGRLRAGDVAELRALLAQGEA